MEVHNLLGPGFLESVYKNSLMHELELQGLRTAREVEVPIQCKRHVVATHRMDLIVEDTVVVELKAITSLSEYPCRTGTLVLEGDGPRGSVAFQFRGTVTCLEKTDKKPRIPLISRINPR